VEEDAVSNIRDKSERKPGKSGSGVEIGRKRGKSPLEEGRQNLKRRKQE